MKNYITAALIYMVSTLVCANDGIPTALFGIWAVEGAVFKGELLVNGEAIYLDTDGTGALIGSDGKHPIGIRIKVKSYDAISNTLSFDATEYSKVVASGAMTYDPKQDSLYLPALWGKDQGRSYKHKSHGPISSAIRSGIGIEPKVQ